MGLCSPVYFSLTQKLCWAQEFSRKFTCIPSSAGFIKSIVSYWSILLLENEYVLSGQTEGCLFWYICDVLDTILLVLQPPLIHNYFWNHSHAAHWLNAFLLANCKFPLLFPILYKILHKSTVPIMKLKKIVTVYILRMKEMPVLKNKMW